MSESLFPPPGALDQRGLMQRARECLRLGRILDAERLGREAVALAPDSPDGHRLLGTILSELGRPAEAVTSLQRAAELAPDNAGHLRALADCLQRAGLGEAAIAACRRWIALEPGAAEAHYQLSLVLWEQGRLGEAWQSCAQALQREPDHAGALLQQAVGLFLAGEAAQALQGFRRVVTLAPDWREAQAHAASVLSYIETSSPEAILQAFRRCAATLGTVPPRPLRDFPAKSTDSDMPLRIGFLSPDFRRHSVAYFIRPVLAGLDRRRFTVIGFYNTPVAVRREDELTRQLRGLCDGWIETAGLDDAQLAQRIVDERIDIAIDLAGYTEGNRLAALALRPAPLQMTWLGSPVTTGLSAIDLRITDALVDPAGYERHQSESPLRLPGCCLCYSPPEDAPPVSELPARDAGFITFGSFNVLAKISATTVRLWAEVLEAVPGSRLLLKSRLLQDVGVAGHTASRFARHGIEPERLQLIGWEAQVGDHLALYHRVDIGLDPFPYNGVTTTCEALWMGVPVVSRSGATHAARFGLSVLTAAGCADLAVNSDQEYVARCVSLAADVAGLAELRAALRPRLAARRLTDATEFTRHFGEGLREAWRQRCADRNYRQV